MIPAADPASLAHSRPVWLIEAGVYGAEVEPLLAEIRRQGMSATLVSHQALRKGVDLAVAGRVLADGACVVGYGTFPFARQIQLHRNWRPGAWCNPTNLDCTTYYAHFGKYLLNQHYAIMPGVEALRQRDWLFAVFGRDGAVFARPTGCQKVFTGRCLTADSFATALAPTRYDPVTPVVVTAPRELGREWRLVVADGRVIAASQYAAHGVRASAPGCPAEVRAFAETLLHEVPWRPDPIFLLDLGESAGRLGLVEIGGFSCCWLYACAVDAVVAAASALASQAAAALAV